MDVSGRKIERIICCSGVISGGHGDSKEMFMDDHLLADACAEFFHLFPYIAKESVAGPSPK